MFNRNPPSVTLCLPTSTLVDSRLRVTLQPSRANGLEKPSQVMIDKVMTLPLDKLSNRIGAVSAGELDQIGASLRAWMDLSGASVALRRLMHTHVLSRSAPHLPR